MLNNITNTASQYFNANWQKYQDTIINNTLYHREMFAVFNTFLNDHYADRPFSLVDVGCGDSSVIAPILVDKPIKKYTGIDAAGDILKLAAVALSAIDCEKEWLAEDMLSAMSSLVPAVDIIFTSYAVHHLSLSQKKDFIRTCKEKLSANGFLIMVDGVRAATQTRDEWLDALQSRIKLSCPAISSQELEIRMQHPRADDYPEPLATFEKMAGLQGWKSFNVLLQQEMIAFMVFAN